MKKINYVIAACMVSITMSCNKDFLEQVPQGQLSSPQVVSQDAVNALLIGAYGLLNGNINGTWGNYAPAPSQWVFGEIGSDDAHKGSSSTDQPYMNQIELHQPTADNDQLSSMWSNYYEGILRCNNTIRTLVAVQASGNKFSDAAATGIRAEARMLRAHYYFLLRRLFVKIPYVDENTTAVDAVKTQNNVDVYPKIKEDLEYAVANLPVTSANGRMNKVIAQSYLGKYLLYQKDYANALTQLNAVIAAKGPIVGMPYWDNFDVTKKNGPEAILSVQAIINPDGTGDNANVGDMLSGLYGTSPVGCCGFYQPTIDLANAYKTDANGLPYLDGSYRTNPYLGTASTASQSFDPRLDYTVGRKGVKYLDYGVMPGNDWIRESSTGGPFVGIKTMVPKALFASQTVSGAAYITTQNVNIIRLSDVYLMAAECNVETGNLGEAMRLVNLVRERAAKINPKGELNIPPGKEVTGANVEIDAANYRVGQYTTFPNTAYARNAIQFERRLELAMEGHRYYDLVRWGNAKTVIESYSAFEGNYIPTYKGITFEPRDAYMPLPQVQIDRSQGNLKQNDGY